MHKITLVALAHRESGLCNAEELLKILRAIEPDTIFEESRPSELDSYRPLEIRAITKYRDSKVFQRVPVDRYDIPANFVAETQRVFDCAKQTRQENLVINEEDYTIVYRHGFEYINNSASA